MEGCGIGDVWQALANSISADLQRLGGGSDKAMAEVSEIAVLRFMNSVWPQCLPIATVADSWTVSVRRS
jgi:hypothetical protein